MDRTIQPPDHGRGARSGEARPQCARTGRVRLQTPGLCSVSPLPVLALIDFFFDLLPPMHGPLTWDNLVKWMDAVLPLLQHGVTLIVCYWIVVLLPMFAFRRLHPAVVVMLKYSSILVAAVCCWQSFIVTYRLLGWLSVVIGMLFAVVGLIPMAMIGAALKSDWDLFTNLLVSAALAILPRILAQFISSREPKKKSLPAPATTYCVDD